MILLSRLVRHYWKIQGEPERVKLFPLNRGYHGVAAGIDECDRYSQFWEHGWSYDDRTLFMRIHRMKLEPEESIDSIREVIEAEGPETIAAFIAEPVQGAGGVLSSARRLF